MLSKSRVLSKQNRADKMDEKYIIAEDRSCSEVIRRIEEAMRFCDRRGYYRFDFPMKEKVVFDSGLGHFCFPKLKDKERMTDSMCVLHKILKVHSRQKKNIFLFLM